ncbi:MAG: hypothetical protein ACXWKN_10995 [Phenylobacterium sp.]
MMHKNLRTALIAAGGYLAGAFLLKIAERAGYLPPDTAAKALQVFNGLALAVYANFLPKTLGTFRNPAQALCMEQILRASGWAFMLGGLGFAITSLLPLREEVPLAVLGSATAYVLGYSIWAFCVRWPSKGDPA